ncbi:RHS repeat-associated core domain-containing protein [Streptomyces sp. MS1.AVA.3]
MRSGRSATSCNWSLCSGPGPAVECSLGFPGQYHDRESGLHHNLFRSYDSLTARYLSPDPLGRTRSMSSTSTWRRRPSSRSTQAAAVGGDDESVIAARTPARCPAVCRRKG